MSTLKIVFAVLFALSLAGCHSSYYSATVDDYVGAAPRVTLGMSPLEVRSILGPSQSLLANTDLRHDEKYLEGETVVEIQYYRSGWQPDGRLTDEEYTPYIFRDGALVGIGWQHHRTVLL